MDRGQIQESLYNFPYHYLPTERGSAWGIGRFLHWGYEYLAVLNNVLELVCPSGPNGFHPRRVIDFGCGDGRLMGELLRRCGALEMGIGVDASERALAFARAWTWGEERANFFKDLGEVDAALLPVDAIVAVEVLEHIPPDNLAGILQALHGVLSADRSLLVSVPTTNVPLNRKHYQHFSLETLCEVTGTFFELVSHRYVHRRGWMMEAIQRAVVNRLWVINNPLWLRFMTILYRRFIYAATAETGAHLICCLQRID